MRIDPNRPLINGEPIEQAVVCLCDIPRSELPFHARRYGRFGVGVSRSVVAQWGTRPVIYIPYSRKALGNWGSRFAGEVRAVLDGLEHFFPDTPALRTKVGEERALSAQEAADDACSLITRDVQAFLKFWDVDLPDEHPENFYMEREWRKFGNLPLAPCLKEVIAPHQYHDRLRAIIDELKVGDRYLIGEVTFSSVSDGDSAKGHQSDA